MESTTRSIHVGSPFFLPNVSGSVMFSYALRVGIRLNAWKMKPIFSRRSSVSCLSLRVDRSVSPMNTLPLVSPSRPAMQCIRVDFPEPLGPMMAVNLPFSKLTSTPSSARTSLSPDPYTLQAFAARAAAFVVGCNVGGGSVVTFSDYCCGRISRPNRARNSS
jgi:hypothetical protein